MKRQLLVTTLLLCTVAAAPAAANDAEYSNYSGTPAPVKNDAISMVSEDIVIEQKDDGYWHVDATYTFKNTTDGTPVLMMGFPEFEGYESSEFLEMKTTVGDEPASVRVEKGAKSVPSLAKGAPLGRVHLFDVAFSPGEEKKVRHTYRMQGGGSVALAIEKTVEYVTRTGALWKGPIGRATFTIRTRDVYELIAWPTEFQFKSLKRFVIQKGARTGMELVLENRDWTPKGDLRVDLVADYDRLLQQRAIGANCPELDISSYRKFEEAPVAERDQFISVEDLSGFDAETLRLCRNWRYARYGYPFSDPALRKRFYGEVGVGKYPPHADGLEDFPQEDRNMAPLMVDENFSPAMLGAEDWFYVKALRAAERSRAAKPADAADGP